MSETPPLEFKFMGLREQMAQPKGRYARPWEAPCPSCGNTQGWKEEHLANGDTMALLLGNTFYCDCGNGTLYYPGFEMMVYGATNGPRARATGKDFMVAQNTWRNQKPPRYDVDECLPETATLTCFCGNIATLDRNASWMPDLYVSPPDEDIPTHMGCCKSCGTVYSAYVEPKERDGYRDELAAWEAREPKTDAEWQPLAWIEGAAPVVDAEASV